MVFGYTLHHLINCSSSAGAHHRLQRSTPTGNAINTSSLPYIEMLRGRDGRDGRDGVPGPHGPQGQRGEQGVAGPPHPRNGGAVYGGKTAAQIPLELNWCMKEGLEEAGIVTWEEVPTTSACPMIQTTLHTNLECKSGATHMELNISHFQEDHSKLHNAPCAVCYASTRVAVTVIPAKTRCPSTWTLEYSGYFMSAYKGYSSSPHYRTMFEYVDKNPDSVPGSAPSVDGAVFHHV